MVGKAEGSRGVKCPLRGTKGLVSPGTTRSLFPVLGNKGKKTADTHGQVCLRI